MNVLSSVTTRIVQKGVLVKIIEAAVIIVVVETMMQIPTVVGVNLRHIAVMRLVFDACVYRLASSPSVGSSAIGNGLFEGTMTALGCLGGSIGRCYELSLML